MANVNGVSRSPKKRGVKGVSVPVLLVKKGRTFHCLGHVRWDVLEDEECFLDITLHQLPGGFEEIISS